MDFTFSDEQEELRRVVRQFLDDKSPELEVRRVMATPEGYDAAVWQQMGEQLGLQGLVVPEAFGGSGYSYLELAVVFEEMGAALLCSPFFATVALAANALVQSGDEEAAARYLPGIASGATIATLALAEEDARWDEAGIGATASNDGDDWTLNGGKWFVIDGHVADLILVAARTGAGAGADAGGAAGSGISLFAVTADAPGLTRTPLATLDLTRKQARLDFDGCPARLIGDAGGAWPVIERTIDLAAVALAAEQVGGAQRCLDLAVEYAKVRSQFGQPVGSFQAIKHKCADVLIEVEAARSAAYYAAWCATATAGPAADELPAAASLAKAYCSEAYFHAAAENVHIHGGIGFTAEHPAHLYYKRAKASELLFGDPTYHRELLAQRIGV